MPSLANQILDSIPENATVERGSLVLAADYDSIGRALKQLVQNRKLVRVGRGRSAALRGGLLDLEGEVDPDDLGPLLERLHLDPHVEGSTQPRAVVR